MLRLQRIFKNYTETGSFNEQEVPVGDVGQNGRIQEQQQPPNSKIDKDEDVGIAVGDFQVGGG